MKETFRRSAAMILSLMFALLALLPSGAPTALASQPERVVIPWDFAAPLPGCAASVEYHQVGSISITVRVVDHGQVIREVDAFHVRQTVLNTQTGESVWTMLEAQDRFDVYEDGSAIDYSSGLGARYVIPGQGLVGAQVGRVVIHIDDINDPYSPAQVLFEAGMQEPLNAMLCELLSN